MYRTNEGESYINASKFAEHVKMLIDQERSLHDYLYNLAAELKAEGRPMTLLRIALEDEFNRHTDHLTDNFVTDILSKVYSNSDFYYKLCLEIWNDERVTEIINEV